MIIDIGGGLDRNALRHLSARSDTRGALQLCVHLALLGGTRTLIRLSLGGALLAPAMMLHGIAVNFLFCPLHETVHGTAFASRCPRGPHTVGELSVSVGGVDHPQAR